MLSSTPVVRFVAIKNGAGTRSVVKAVIIASLRDERNLINVLHDCAFGAGFAPAQMPCDVTFSWHHSARGVTAVIRAQSGLNAVTFVMEPQL